MSKISFIDWLIIFVYLIGMIAMSFYLSKGQESKEDYYLGGNNTGFFPIAMSTIATQCSSNSILGGPAFVAFSVGGGLLWLQYEVALPFAMIFIMFFLLPFFKKLNIISIYAYLEKRFGFKTRLLLSLIFQLTRAFATGVLVYGISSILAFILGISYFWAVVLVAVVTIIYDSIGGIKAVIYSDMIQIFVIYACIIISFFYSLNLLGGFDKLFELIPLDRLQSLDFSKTGLGDSSDFSFLPMFIGGFFMYVAYYGCDQSQMQRQLSSKNLEDANKSLFLNGILRFPLVLCYCLFGLSILAFSKINPDFLNTMPVNPSGSANLNAAAPLYVISQFPVGLVGLFIVALFASAMSSLDSIINSLGAASMEDVVKPFVKLESKTELLISKLLTVFWGTLCTYFSFYVAGISDSVIVSVNKISSCLNGPILALFLIGILLKKVSESQALLGFIFGIALNVYLWLAVPELSWMWWNVFGFLVSFALAYLLSVFNPVVRDIDSELCFSIEDSRLSSGNLFKYLKYLLVYGVMIFLLLFVWDKFIV